MLEKRFSENLEWFPLWLAGVTALWGGPVSYFRLVLASEAHSWTKALIPLSMSGFAGLMCWLGCVQFSVPGALTAICTGLAGHMGAKFIAIVENRFRHRLYDGPAGTA